MGPTSSTSTTATPATLRADAIADLDRLIEITIDARAELLSYLDALELTRRHLADGKPAVDVKALLNIPARRSSFSNHMNFVERARNAARASFWRLQIAEGSTITEVARTWGLSRQLVSRALSGSRRDPDR